MIFLETCTAPTNIAVIKYWGKDENRGLNTPINSSASVTLSQDDLMAQTTVAASPDFTSDRLWLNGKEEDTAGDGTHAKRLRKCLAEMRRLARDRVDSEGKVVCKAADLASYKVHVASRNTFPTAAGLASSAAGYACLVYTLAKLYNVKEEFEGQLSTIARQGSGSACRSLYGGFVKWVKGDKKDATDSMAVQVADEAHWPELRAVILVVNAGKKDTPSTEGMQTSVATSPLLAFRAKHVVEARLAEMEAAYKKRDFATFGMLSMQDSNQFHATCLDTYPPIFYLNDVSRQAIRLVHSFNECKGRVAAAYTFDAGPNAVIYCLDQDRDELLAYMLHFFPAPSLSVDSYTNKPELLRKARGLPLDAGLITAGEAIRTPAKGDVKMIYCTSTGDGPRTLELKDSLIDPTTGMPLANEVQKWQQTLGSGKGGCPVNHRAMLGTAFAATAGIALIRHLLR